MIKETTRRVLTGIGMVALVGAVSASDAAAQSASSDFDVTASVVANCVIDTPSDLAFGAYEPAGANAAAPLDGDTTIEVACTRGSTGVYVGLDLGDNASGSTRRMVGQNDAETLDYELYSDAGRTLADVWGNDAVSGVSYVPVDSSPASLTVFGRVPAAQDVIVDTYQDTVTATINF